MSLTTREIEELQDAIRSIMVCKEDLAKMEKTIEMLNKKINKLYILVDEKLDD